MLKIGQKFGKLLVIKKDDIKRRWICECECGNKKSIHETALNQGSTKSCGCLRGIHNKNYNEKSKKRFLQKIEKINQCWNWKGDKNKQGYGLFSFRRKYMLAHRFSWTMFKEEIPQFINVCHKCDNTSCVNPDHLFLGTQKDNVLDMFGKNRKSHSKEKHPGKKITTDIIEKVFSLRELGLTQLKIGVLCGICQHMVSKILRKKHWLQTEANYGS